MFGLVLPFASAMINGLGANAAAAEAVERAFLWLVPYFVGRDELGVHELAQGLFFAALIYAPLCWVEMIYFM